MGLLDVLKKMNNKLKENREQELSLGDDETSDKYLRSLRREARLIKERKEKIMLRKMIANDQKQEMAKNLYGIKNTIVKQKNKLVPKKKKQPFMGRFDLKGGRYI